MLLARQSTRINVIPSYDEAAKADPHFLQCDRAVQEFYAKQMSQLCNNLISSTRLDSIRLVSQQRKESDLY